MKINCILIDDEPLALQLMESYVRKTDCLELKGTFENASSAAGFLESNKVDLIFCDIQMPGVNGIEFSKKLPEETRIVFTTAFSNYAVESYRVNALDYLVKPISYKDFLEAVEKASKWFERLREAKASKQENNKILIKVEHKLVSIDSNKLVFIEGMKDYSKFYVENSEPLVSLISLKALEAQLPEGQYFRVHKSYIVNISKVKQIERGYIVFKDNSGKRIKAVPISDNTKDTFLAILGNKIN